MSPPKALDPLGVNPATGQKARAASNPASGGPLDPIAAQQESSIMFSPLPPPRMPPKDPQ
jgi:hypothetical protein